MVNKTTQTIEKLLKDFVDDSSTANEFDAHNLLSPFLTGSFDLHHATSLGKHIFFAESREDYEGIATLKKRLLQLSTALGISPDEQIVFYAPSLPAKAKRSFLEQGMSFATSDGDLYIPFLSFRIVPQKKRTTAVPRRFRGSDQSIYLFALYADGPFTQEEVINSTGLSAASASRALANLVLARALDFEVAGKTGRLKNFFKSDAKTYYRVGREFFGEAVRSVHHTNQLPEGLPLFASGLSALAVTSSLLEPSRQVWSVAPEYAPYVKEADPDPEFGYCHDIQVLNYDPEPFAMGDCVDPFTMIQTIPPSELNDERVRIALREAMGGYEWYRD